MGEGVWPLQTPRMHARARRPVGQEWHCADTTGGFAGGSRRPGIELGGLFYFCLGLLFFCTGR